VDHRALRLGSVAFVVSTFALFACSGSQPKQAGGADDFGATRDSAPGSTPSAGGDMPPASSGETATGAGSGDAGRLNKEQKDQVDIALRRGGSKAVQCPDVVPNGPSGDAAVKVTFDGKKGRAVDASVGPPFAGTPIEACIKRAYIDEIVLPFDGGPLEMSTTVKIAAKAAPVDDKKKPKK